MEKGYPLILVFYLDRELMSNPKIINPFTQMVDTMLMQKEANAMAFFLPTDGEERIECINPIMIKEADMERVNKLIQDIKKNFSVGDDVLPEIEIKQDNSCECGGNCKCDKDESEV